MTWSNFTEPRCTTCSSILVHSGAVCFSCDEHHHYGAPVRTSPLLMVFPSEDTDAGSVTQMSDWQEQPERDRRPVA